MWLSSLQPLIFDSLILWFLWLNKEKKRNGESRRPENGNRHLAWTPLDECHLIEIIQNSRQISAESLKDSEALYFKQSCNFGFSILTGFGEEIISQD